MSAVVEAFRAQLPHTLSRTDFGAALGPKYEGKVRDVYAYGDQLVLITTDRVSAFDHVLGTIPFKGQILTQVAQAGFEATTDILPHHVIAHPDPNVVIARRCRPYPVEFIVRGFITGSLWRDYRSGAAAAYELPLSAGLTKNARLEQPILTPSTKAARGAHDEPISKRAIVERGLMTEAQLEAAAEAAVSLYRRGIAIAADRGLLLVDTKYELGEDPDGRLTVIDEIHTPDSSRYWRADTYEARVAAGQEPEMLDKENLRQWLMDTHGYCGHGEPPPLSDDIRILVAERYAELFALMRGEAFVPTVGPVGDRIRQNLAQAGLPV